MPTPDLKIGDIVIDVSSELFSGYGKLLGMDENQGTGVVGFFLSPLESNSLQLKAPLETLSAAALFEEQSVFCYDSSLKRWRRARYGGERPDGRHLVIYRSDDHSIVDIDNIYVLNLVNGESLRPEQFLKARCNDTPHFYGWRQSFVQSYIEQRGACKSISSIPSSSIELEPHQLAVVRRVLKDENKKYLLADEVGLGKTVEAGIILREQVLKGGHGSIAVIGVPGSLVDQWRIELKERFYLEDLFDQSLFICAHEDLSSVLEQDQISIIIIDEAHQLAEWAWAGSLQERSAYQLVANACRKADTCLLLSGTPLNGNEVNFLAMLHLVAPETYQLSDEGITQFKQRISERERLGGIYQALVPSNDNSTLSDLLDQILAIFPNDQLLTVRIEKAREHVDWMADEEGEERESALKELRSYLGENYRLHQRLLRNRREDPVVSNLFPGLDGALISAWKIDSTALSVEQYLDSIRSEYFETNSSFLSITKENYKDWVEESMVSPMQVSSRAKRVLLNSGVELEREEIDVLKTLIEFSEQEQREKDLSLLYVLNDWHAERPKGRVVVFCGAVSVADHVSNYLNENSQYEIERHTPGLLPKYCSDESIKILVCDKAGEDGLNLNGGEKLVVHYSLPLSISRVEQRLGRVNRYSAHISAKPVKSILLVPKCEIYSHIWAKILIDTLGIFRKSIASLQYVLEGEIEKAWAETSVSGIESLTTLEERLSGDTGMIALERHRVKVQEDLNKMDEEIDSSIRFANQVDEEDENAEKHASMMFDWITRGLQFEKIEGDYKGTFRFKYRTGVSKGRRTLMDVRTLVSECITGIDHEQSDYTAPVTALMSADRQVASHGRQVYPFRFGQPFVDVIYKALQQDVRGICSAMFRFIKMKSPVPIAFFRLDWLISMTDRRSGYTDQRIGDEKYKPRIVKHWINQNGEMVVNEQLISLLEQPYYKESGGRYQDMNIRAEYWEKIEDVLPEEHWQGLVDNILKCSREDIHNEIRKTSTQFKDNICPELLSASVTILVSK